MHPSKLAFMNEYRDMTRCTHGSFHRLQFLGHSNAMIGLRLCILNFPSRISVAFHNCLKIRMFCFHFLNPTGLCLLMFCHGEPAVHGREIHNKVFGSPDKETISSIVFGSLRSSLSVMRNTSQSFRCFPMDPISESGLVAIS